MRYFPIIILIFLAGSLPAQFIVQGTVHAESGEILPGSTVLVEGTFIACSTDEKGEFILPPLSTGSYFIKASHLGYSDLIIEIALQDDAILNFQMQVQAVQAEAFTVLGYRAHTDVPMAYQNLSKEELQKRNLGVDVPALLDVTPSLYFTSDAGTGIGYTYLRLRGNDQSSINVMINGIPLNDAESHGVFWVDLPDLASSSQSIQIQRGVGTSVNGAGAFGGSVNVLTQALETEPYSHISLSGGSFDTRRLSIKAGTGLLNEQWSMDTRISRITSDGFIDRSAAELSSYYIAAGYVNGKNSIRLLGFGGHELTQQAWYGVPRARIDNDVDGMLSFALDNGFSEANTLLLLNADRKYNYYTYENEVDDYLQNHYQLHYARGIHSTLQVSAALHYTRGLGFFEQFQDADNYFDDTAYGYYGLLEPVIGNDTLVASDFVRRRWLDNHFYGLTSNISWKKGKWDSVLGIAANRYEGSHFGEVINASFLEQIKENERYYENEAFKSEYSAYLKSTYSFKRNWTAYLDLQQRMILYQYQGILANGELADQHVDFSFFNPKAGITYTDKKGHRAFISLARAHKEPNRDDLVNSILNSRPKAQTLDDLEMGYSYRAKKYAVEIVMFAMQYRDQLINTGELNDVGERIRSNVDASYRRGLEFIAQWKLNERFQWKANATWSENIIVKHREIVVDYDADFNSTLLIEDLGNAPISFSPAFMAFSEWDVLLFKKQENLLNMSLGTKYVGEQHIDNTGSDERILESFLVNDLTFSYRMIGKKHNTLTLTLQVRNLLDEVYESNGWTYRYRIEGQEVSYDALFPQAGRNFLAGISLDL